jgi:hypothetical protein
MKPLRIMVAALMLAFMQLPALADSTSDLHSVMEPAIVKECAKNPVPPGVDSDAWNKYIGLLCKCAAKTVTDELGKGTSFTDVMDGTHLHDIMVRCIAYVAGDPANRDLMAIIGPKL